MKWYKIRTKLQSYKWYMFAGFVAILAWGSVRVVTEKDARVPTFLFLGLLIIYAILWVIATFDLVKYNRGEKKE